MLSITHCNFHGRSEKEILKYANMTNTKRILKYITNINHRIKQLNYRPSAFKELKKMYFITVYVQPCNVCEIQEPVLC